MGDAIRWKKKGININSILSQDLTRMNLNGSSTIVKKCQSCYEGRCD